MADELETVRRQALLSQCIDAGLGATAEVEEFICEYFTSLPEQSDGESDDDEEDGSTSGSESDDVNEELDQDHDHDGPLVVDIGGEEGGAAGDCQNVAGFACHCKHIVNKKKKKEERKKEVGEPQAPDPRGCISQFSPEEILACQLSLQDMEKGIYI